MKLVVGHSVSNTNEQPTELEEFEGVLLVRVRHKWMRDQLVLIHALYEFCDVCELLTHHLVFQQEVDEVAAIHRRG